LAFAAVIAWQLLALRDLARRPEPIPASRVLRPNLLIVLAALRPRLFSDGGAECRFVGGLVGGVPAGVGWGWGKLK